MLRTQTNKQMFDRMRAKGLFWSYAPNITYDAGKDSLLCETVLKYGDLDDIRELFVSFGKKEVRRVWEQSLRSDVRFKRLNYFLARVFFGLDVEACDFEGLEHARLAKFRRIAG